MEQDTKLVEAIETLVGLARRHKVSSGIVARDVVLFGTEPKHYPFDPSHLMLLSGVNKYAALKIINSVIITGHSIEPILGRDTLEELHAEWYADKKRRAA